MDLGCSFGNSFNPSQGRLNGTLASAHDELFLAEKP
jgi:hypothetical protein